MCFLMMTQDEVQCLKAKLEKTGIDKVRENLTLNVYGARKIQFVRSWLDEKEKEKKHTQKKIELDIKNKANQLSKTQNLLIVVTIVI